MVHGDTRNQDVPNIDAKPGATELDIEVRCQRCGRQGQAQNLQIGKQRLDVLQLQRGRSASDEFERGDNGRARLASPEQACKECIPRATKRVDQDVGI
ncbi:MAG: hypothetical protein ABI577_04825 [bacterium]